MKSVTVLLAIFMCVGLCLADESESQESSIKVQAPKLEDSTVGFDLHKDYFFFEDKPVEEAFKRRRFVSTKLTLAGQRPDMTGREVKPAVNPFVVAQRAVHSFGVSSDRWDVKEDAYGNQYFALYHADNVNKFVVNKLRGHLLRQLVNAVQDYLPILDEETVKRSESSDEGSKLKDISKNVEQIISRVVTDIDENIRSSMKSGDSSSATVTIAIVTKNNVISVSVGDGKVLAYDETSEIHDLSKEKTLVFDAQLKPCQSIGDNKGRVGLCFPVVNITPRIEKVLDEDADADEDETKELQFLVVESPSLAGLIDDELVAKTVVSQINQHKLDSKHEQELYTSSVEGVLQQATASLNVIQRVAKADQSIIMVGLETNYELIH